MSDQFPYTFGKYRVEAEIGRGGFGAVFRARDIDLDRLVAVKIMDPLYLRDRRWVARFRREAKVMAKLDHPNIVPIYDTGEDDGRLFLTMKLIDGPNLSHVIARDGNLPWETVVKITDQISSALDYAHARKVVHRDLKPGNILISNGDAMLTDFGLAKMVEDNSQSISVSGGIAGTYNYMPPEVFNNEDVTPASDVYALGCVLYEMLMGRMLFDGKTTAAIVGAHLKGISIDESLPEGIPTGTRHLLQTALAKNPEDRYQSAGELAEELSRLSTDRLSEPYATLEKTLEDQQWPEAIAIAEEIRSQDPNYRDVIALEERAMSGNEIAQRHYWSAQWQSSAEQALALENFDEAHGAINQWRRVSPDDPKLQVVEKELLLAEQYVVLQQLMADEKWQDAQVAAASIYDENPTYRNIAGLRSAIDAHLKSPEDDQEHTAAAAGMSAAAASMGKVAESSPTESRSPQGEMPTQTPAYSGANQQQVPPPPPPTTTPASSNKGGSGIPALVWWAGAIAVVLIVIFGLYVMSRGTGDDLPEATAIVSGRLAGGDEPAEEPVVLVEQVEVTRVVTVVEEVEVVPEVEEVAAPVGPVTLNWNWRFEPSSLDPAKASDTSSIDALANLFMGLTRVDPQTGDVQRHLATDWDVSPDGRVYTFYLRNDVPWVNYNPSSEEWTQEIDFNGNPRFVTAHDVVYGVKRSIDPQTEANYAYVLYDIANAELVNQSDESVSLDDVGVAAIDDVTVEFTLREPAAHFPSIVSMWVAYAQPQWAIEEWGDKWTEAGLIVTNGPMGVEEWLHDGQLNLAKNPLWPDSDVVQIEYIEGAMVNDAATAFAMYENNELDTAFVPSEQIETARADSVLGAELVNAVTSCTYYYGFVNNKPPLDDVRVRRALIQAVDRQNLIDNVNVLGGGRTPATSFAPPGMFGAPEPGTVGLTFDRGAAQSSLQEYLNERNISIDEFNGLGITLMHNTSEGHANIAAAVQQMWQDNLGVEVQVENQEWAVFLDTIRTSTSIEEMPHIYRMAWCADYADENSWVHVVFNTQAGSNRLRRNCHDANCSSVGTTEFDELTAAAAIENDPDTRRELYVMAEKILAEEEAAYLPLYYFGDVKATKPWLERTFSPFNGHEFWTWSIDQTARFEAMGQ